MSELATTQNQRWGEGVRVSQARLRHIEFDWRGATTLDVALRFQFGLQVHRYSVMQIGVDFSVTSIDADDLTATVTFNIIMEVEEGSPESTQLNRALKLLAAGLAPITLYPFCREALTSMAQRAGLTDFAPPITNVGGLWTLDEVDLPDPPRTDGGEVE